MRSTDRQAPTVPHSDPSSPPSPRVLLMVVGPGHLATHPIAPDGAVVFGRSPTCDVCLEHRKISRRHAAVRSDPTMRRGAIVLEDLGSMNGIVTGRTRLAPGGRLELELGESFQLGPFTVLVVAAAALEDVAAESTNLTVLDPTTDRVSPMVSRFARSLVNVLVVGETGTGKELLAHTVHELSERRGPLVAINAAALSESLLESELFGHERGAFTGAVRSKPGLLETAAGGTVFLDEIGEMPLSLQAKLLRAIETREVYPVGGLKPVALDVRFIAATHRDLDAEVTAGRFRSDLFYRLNGVTLRLPPLRERRATVGDLARGFLEEAAATAHRPVPRLGVDAIVKLIRYEWPGNVRELRSVMERALFICDGDEINAAAIVTSGPPPVDATGFIELARRHRGNVAAIARDLATSRSQVHRLAQRFGVVFEQLRAG